MSTRLTDLVGADPFTFDGPRAETLVIRVITGEVAMLDQASAGVPAMKMDDFELYVCELRIN